MGRKKKFIDKKKAATFQILARDSSDPNYAEGPSGDRVFVRIDGNHSVNNTFFDDDQNDVGSGELADADPDDDIYADAPDDSDDEDEGGDRVPRTQFRTPGTGTSSGNLGLPDHVRREILELGFPDDGYNYLHHLREIKNTGGGSAYYENPKAKVEVLPRDVKAYDASRIEIAKVNDDDAYEKSIYSVASKTVGVKIQKVLDPEVAALLDDSDLSRFGSDDEDLEEDFVVNANLPEEDADLELEKKLSLVEVTKKESNKSSLSYPKSNTVDVMDAVRNNVVEFAAEKPRVRRHLDDQFDMLALQEYGIDSDDEYDGATSEENEYNQSLAGKLNHALKDRVMDDLDLDGKYIAPSDLLHDEKRENNGSLESAAILIDRCKEYGEKYENENEDDNVLILEESSDESEVWDCETIITTYSNLDNHPGKIGAPESRRKKKLAETVTRALPTPTHVISLKGKQKLPLDFLPHSRKPADEIVKDEKKLSTETQKRKQHGQESKEEKKERKAAVKDERREARRVKKELKVMYKSESHQAQKVAAFTGPSSIHLM